jgi:hypothetical protein
VGAQSAWSKAGATKHLCRVIVAFPSCLGHRLKGTVRQTEHTSVICSRKLGRSCGGTGSCRSSSDAVNSPCVPNHACSARESTNKGREHCQDCCFAASTGSSKRPYAYPLLLTALQRSNGCRTRPCDTEMHIVKHLMHPGPKYSVSSPISHRPNQAAAATGYAF